jgi:putative hemolysin
LLEEIAARLSIAVPEHESATLGGFVIARLGRIARIGDLVSLEGYTAKVIEMKGRRVSKLLLAPSRPDATREPTQP